MPTFTFGAVFADLWLAQNIAFYVIAAAMVLSVGA